MNQNFRYWLLVCHRAWADALAANNWSFPRVARRAIVLVAFAVLLVWLGGFDLAQDKVQLALLSLAAIAVVFLGELAARVAIAPARIHEEQLSRIDALSKNRAAAARNEAAFADLESEFEMSRVLLVDIGRASGDTDLANVHERAKAWDEQVRAKLKKHALPEVFAFSSIAELPRAPTPLNLGFVVLSTGASEMDILRNYVATKQGKLRLILMRLESRTSENEEA